MSAPERCRRAMLLMNTTGLNLDMYCRWDSSYADKVTVFVLALLVVVVVVVGLGLAVVDIHSNCRLVAPEEPCR